MVTFIWAKIYNRSYWSYRTSLWECIPIDNMIFNNGNNLLKAQPRMDRAYVRSSAMAILMAPVD